MLAKRQQDDSLWTVALRCSFFKGEIKSVKVLRSSGNQKIDAQAVAEMRGRHVPEVSFGTSRHEYWRTITWTLPKGAPYAEPQLPPKLTEPTVLVGLPFEVVTGMSAPTHFRIS